MASFPVHLPNCTPLDTHGVQPITVNWIWHPTPSALLLHLPFGTISINCLQPRFLSFSSISQERYRMESLPLCSYTNFAFFLYSWEAVGFPFSFLFFFFKFPLRITIKIVKTRWLTCNIIINGLIVMHGLVNREGCQNVT